MAVLTLSDPIAKALEEMAVGRFRSTGERHADGMWRVPVDDAVKARLETLRQTPEETDDDLVRRLLTHRAAAASADGQHRRAALVHKKLLN
ncbi:MAG TPA: hypothetical protein VK741_23640 [Acetobacteraceae bacterium]|jgi:hypothetical protein|nr:hypothetical protein [Acetobacteraceae bacterium]